MIGMCVHDLGSFGTKLAASLFVAGFVGGFSHCAGMCGPFVLAQTAKCPSGSGILKKLSDTALMWYHLGRATTYIALAILFSFFINIAVLNGNIRVALSVVLLFTAACIFLINAVPALSALFPWLSRIGLPKTFTMIQRLASPFMQTSSAVHSYILGVLLGFMPCGLVVAALMAAASAGSVLKTTIAMGAFVLGTVPALWLTAFGGHAVKALWPSKMPHITAVFSLISGISILYIAGTLVL